MSKKRRSRSAATSKRRSPLPELALGQVERDLIGIFVVAVGVWGAVVGYTGSAGGRLGEALVAGCELIFGVTAVLVPPALVAGGALLVARSLLVVPLRAVVAVALAWLAVATVAAGGLFGVGPAPASAEAAFATTALRDGGGAVGAGTYVLINELLQRPGAYLFVVLALATALRLASARPLAEALAALTPRLAAIARDSVARARERRAAAARTAVGQGAAFDAPAWPPPAGDDVAGSHRDEGELADGASAFTAPLAIDPAARFPDIYSREHEGSDTPDEHTETELAGAQGSVDADESAFSAGDDAGEGDDGGASDTDAVPLDEPSVAVSDEAVPMPRPAPASAAARTPQGLPRGGVTFADGTEYSLPSPRLLRRSEAAPELDQRQIERTGRQLVEALGHFHIDARVIGTVVGPHVTRYELRLAPGTKMSKIAQLKDDLAYALAAEHVRILAPIPGKQAVGVEVPNRMRRMVHLGDVFGQPPRGWSPLTVWLGKDIAGNAIAADIAKQPHILVAGATGSGKSGCVNAMLSSILLRATPNEVRLALVDPKRVELNHYEQVPHLLTPVVTSPRAAANVLSNLVREMEERYGLMSRVKARSLPELNRLRARAGEATLPYILCVIDELADLMMIAPAEVEDSIIRLAQKSRAVGIHLVLATQRPSADVITGLIKANIPARIAFAVSSQTDSRVILDQNGAESLLGQGDMLFRPAGASKLARIQGAFISEEEIARLTAHWHAQGEPELREEMLGAPPGDDDDGQGDADPDHDPLLAEAIRTVVALGTASTSMLQRRLRVGYTRAGRLIDMMERLGVVSGYEGSKARQVLISEADLPRVLAQVEGTDSALDDTAPAPVSGNAGP